MSEATILEDRLPIRHEMAWMYRQLGMPYRKIGEKLGCSGARAREMIIIRDRKADRLRKQNMANLLQINLGI